jgi:hypothetical protein
MRKLSSLIFLSLLLPAAALANVPGPGQAGTGMLDVGVVGSNPARASGTRIRVITGYTRPQYRPYRITTTGDGSGFYGGRTGHATEPPSARGTDRLGRMKWTNYNTTEADATGVEWGKFGPGATAVERYHVDASVKIHVYRPANGVFTRMIVVQTFYRDAGYIHGRHTYHFSDQSGYWSETS